LQALKKEKNCNGRKWLAGWRRWVRVSGLEAMVNASLPATYNLLVNYPNYNPLRHSVAQHLHNFYEQILTTFIFN
jgi:hypothetical protein